MSVPNTFTNGTTADAEDVNENFTHVNDAITDMVNTTSESGNDYTNSATYTDVMSLSVTVARTSTLLCFFRSDGWQNNTTSADSRYVRIYNNTSSTQIGELQCLFPASSQFFKHNPNLFAVQTSVAAGSVTIKVQQKSGNTLDGGFVSTRDLTVLVIPES